MSYYNLKLSENPTFCEVCKFSQEYVEFVNSDDSDEVMVLSGTRLKHVEQLIEFVKRETGVSLNLMTCVDLIYVLAAPQKTNDESYCRSFLISEARVRMGQMSVM